jgi:hypothetical protein
VTTLGCGDCGYEYEKPDGDIRCPNCKEQGGNPEVAGTNVRVIDMASIVRIKANRFATETAAAVKGAVDAATHRKWTGGKFFGPDAAQHGGEESPCPGCGRVLGTDSSTIDGICLCARCAAKQITRRSVNNRPRDERWGESMKLTDRPAKKQKEPEKPEVHVPKGHKEADRFRRTNHRQQIVSKFRMKEMRRRADNELPFPR